MQAQFLERLKVFLINPSTESLHNHKLNGKFKDFKSINITGDYRAVYSEDQNTISFVFIGTHSQIYG
ncbi:hypothetical protein A3J61_02585 [Candidatus Nomurabacteria bacterium RIFCSPHIGHO2_02_FULL_38_15]|uniref:Plasmid stabilization protein n=1 Tax=Candidatus Nomurabacteria bacterium RIFCSPHIGHO2_02_FULL_38_15 TaxID=1801752 RepID=A0A1F6VQ04_9BACT|nr:MAG: hypothetical protein A3J61_02585 [Candidatus Nomurabacteria bacterium RIFCSPHIGHO2_02_FULL_38_15]